MLERRKQEDLRLGLIRASNKPLFKNSRRACKRRLPMLQSKLGNVNEDVECVLNTLVRRNVHDEVASN